MEMLLSNRKDQKEIRSNYRVELEIWMVRSNM